MAQTQYKCTKCGRHFDEPVEECPDCLAEGEIVAVKSIPRWLYIAVAVLAIIIIILLLRGCPGDIRAEIKRDTRTNDVTIAISGMSKSVINDSRVIVYNKSEQVATIKINDEGVAKYAGTRMIEGECYTFDIVQKKSQQKIEGVIWSGGNPVCIPVRPASVAPVVRYKKEENRSEKPYTWTVTIVVLNIDSLAEVTYQIDDKVQRDSVFTGILPGDYEIRVSSIDRTTDLPLNLPPIKEPRKPITRQEVQTIFNQVSAGKVSAGEALERIASGSVKLAAPVDGYVTLTELMTEMALGATTGDEVFYDVVEFDTNPVTGLVKSGSLKVRKR